MRGSQASFLIGVNTVAELNSITNAFTSDALDTTAFASDIRTFIAGLRSGTINISGFYDPTDTTGQVAMMTAFLAGSILTDAKFLTNGTNGFSADAIVTNYTVDATVASTVNFSATLQLTGTITVES